MRMTNLVQQFALLPALVLVAGCATIVEGSDQSIAVASDPNGATCEFQREGQAVAFVKSTPGTVMVEKSTKELIVRCSKESYEDEVVNLSSKFEGMTFGNIIFGGIIGVGVDAASGAMHYYPENVTILMAPTSFSSIEERDTFYEARRMRITADVDKAIAKIRKECQPDNESSCTKETEQLEKARDQKLADMEVKRSRARIASSPATSGSNPREETRIDTPAPSIDAAAKAGSEGPTPSRTVAAPGSSADE